VRSTTSFFAAARSAEAPPDEVILISAPPQETPGEDGRLFLELRRTRRGQIRDQRDSGQRAAQGAALAAKSGSDDGQTFCFAAQASDNDAPIVRPAAFVSVKGASRTAAQLLGLLQKVGQETNLEMYQSDVAEFSIPVARSSDEGVTLKQVAALSLTPP